MRRLQWYKRGAAYDSFIYRKLDGIQQLGSLFRHHPLLSDGHLLQLLAQQSARPSLYLPEALQDDSRKVHNDGFLRPYRHDRCAEGIPDTPAAYRPDRTAGDAHRAYLLLQQVLSEKQRPLRKLLLEREEPFHQMAQGEPLALLRHADTGRDIHPYGCPVQLAGAILCGGHEPLYSGKHHQLCLRIRDADEGRLRKKKRAEKPVRRKPTSKRCALE